MLFNRKKDKLVTYNMFPKPLCSKPWFESHFLTKILNQVDEDEGTIKDKRMKYKSILLSEKIKIVEKNLISHDVFEHYLGREKDKELELENTLKEKGYSVHKFSEKYRVERVEGVIETFWFTVELKNNNGGRK